MSEPELTQLGRYKMLALLGKGGFAHVYKAQDTHLGRVVALKVLDPVLSRDPAFISRFEQEAQVTASLSHPNIVTLFDFGEANGRFFIAMQYVAGRNLHDLTQDKGDLPFDQIALIVEQVGAALDYAHARNLVHRDIKPNNIILDDNGRAILTDFGIVKALEGTTVYTTASAVVGTPAYSSPEQIESLPLDHRTDLYALGVVAYELCTGRVPFEANSPLALLRKIADTEPRLPSEVNVRVASPIEQVLLKAIAKQPDQRYQSGAEFAAALASAVEQAKGEWLQSVYERANALFAKEDFDAAESNLRQVLAVQPGHRDAQILLDKATQRREWKRQYTELAELVSQARARAAKLRQANPNQTDPAEVLGILAAEPMDRPTASFTPPTAQHSRRTAAWVQLAVGVILLGGAALALLIGIAYANVWIDGVTAQEVWKVEQMKVGNLIIGLGLGVGLGGLLLLAFSGRKSG